MNPYAVALGIGAIALVSGAVASIPAINQGEDSEDFPIDYSDTGDTGLDLYPNPLDPQTNVNAFLAVIRAGESSDNYYAKVGGGNISSLATYPTWAGVGNSHAVGAYQFEPETWREAAAALGLTDFSEASQDAAAIFLLKRRGAYQAIVDGQIQTASNLLKNEWEMFKQPKWTNVAIAQVYVANGGMS